MPGHTQSVTKKSKQGGHERRTAAFIKRLWEIVNDQSYQNIIKWITPDDDVDESLKGDPCLFGILDVEEFHSSLIPKMIKFANYTIFQRKMFDFGFEKVKDPSHNREIFRNQFFKRNCPHLLKFIQRRRRTNDPTLDFPGSASSANGVGLQMNLSGNTPGIVPQQQQQPPQLSLPFPPPPPPQQQPQATVPSMSQQQQQPQIQPTMITGGNGIMFTGMPQAVSNTQINQQQRVCPQPVRIQQQQQSSDELLQQLTRIATSGVCTPQQQEDLKALAMQIVALHNKIDESSAMVEMVKKEVIDSQKRQESLQALADKLTATATHCKPGSERATSAAREATLAMPSSSSHSGPSAYQQQQQQQQWRNAGTTQGAMVMGNGTVGIQQMPQTGSGQFAGNGGWNEGMRADMYRTGQMQFNSFVPVGGGGSGGGNNNPQVNQDSEMQGMDEDEKYWGKYMGANL